MTDLLFVYGVLKDPEKREDIVGNEKNSFPDSLEGYAKSTITIEGKTFPILVPTKDSSVNGEVVKVTPEELKKFDEFETKAYKRIEVTLKSGKKAWVYVSR